jgi:hypothetical protein
MGGLPHSTPELLRRAILGALSGWLLTIHQRL